MRDFVCSEWTIVKGKRVALFPQEQMPEDLWNPDDLKGETVLIDGEEHMVMGVETFAVQRSPSHPYRHSFGLMVDVR